MVSVQEKICEIIIEKVGSQVDAIFDVGCGNGIYLNILCRRLDACGDGIDIVPEFIEEGKSSFPDPRITLRVMDGCNLTAPILSQKYDIILLIGSRVVDLGVYPPSQIKKNLAIYYSLLKKNGTIVIFESTDLTGDIEPRAGWQFKTLSQINILRQWKNEISYLKVRNGKFVIFLPKFIPQIIDLVLLVGRRKIKPTFSYLIFIQKI